MSNKFVQRAILLIGSPRELMVSRLLHILGLRRHHVHDWLSNAFADATARLIALINGACVPKVEIEHDRLVASQARAQGYH